MYKRKPILKAQRIFRRILLCLAGVAFIFAAFMSFYYVGHKRGYIKQEDVAPTVFATDVWLYQTKAYWGDTPEQYAIAKKLLKLGLFDRQYYYAGREMMNRIAADGYEPAVIYADANFRK